MTNPLQGRSIALAESRQLDELAGMLEKEGARTLRCPMISILDHPDEETVVAWLRDLIADRFDYVVLFTGEGVRRLLGFAERARLRQEVVNAFGRTSLITRGPKPVRALKEIGLKPTRIAASPTTEGVIATLREETLEGKTVGVQLYSDANPPLEEFLKNSGAKVAAILPYVYAPDSDAEQVADLIGRLSRGEVDVFVLTSSPQVDRLFSVAAEKELGSALSDGLKKTRVAAVGPVVADNLRNRGAPIHVCPEQGFVMKNLVKHVKEDLARAGRRSS